MGNEVIISAAVEGMVDEAVVGKLIVHAGAKLGAVYGKEGKSFLKQKIVGYNRAAMRAPWVILVDLDKDADCAPLLCNSWLPKRAKHLCFRVAVREVESWLLADPSRLAKFLGVSSEKVPKDPESLDDPKKIMVNLARNSRRTAIQKDMVPRGGSGRQVGPAYSSRLIEFISLFWRPEIAMQRSESLRGSIGCLRHLVASYDLQNTEPVG